VWHGQATASLSERMERNHERQSHKAHFCVRHFVRVRVPGRGEPNSSGRSQPDSEERERSPTSIDVAFSVSAISMCYLCLRPAGSISRLERYHVCLRLWEAPAMRGCEESRTGTGWEVVFSGIYNE
jgi:hypothetical protein